MKMLKVSQSNSDNKLFDRFIDDGGTIKKTQDYHGEECWDINTPDGENTYTVYQASEVLQEIANYYRKTVWIEEITKPQPEMQPEVHNWNSKGN